MSRLELMLVRAQLEALRQFIMVNEREFQRERNTHDPVNESLQQDFNKCTRACRVLAQSIERLDAHQALQ